MKPVKKLWCNTQVNCTIFIFDGLCIAEYREYSCAFISVCTCSELRLHIKKTWNVNEKQTKPFLKIQFPFKLIITIRYHFCVRTFLIIWNLRLSYERLGMRMISRVTYLLPNKKTFLEFLKPTIFLFITEMIQVWINKRTFILSMENILNRYSV